MKSDRRFAALFVFFCIAVSVTFLLIGIEAIYPEKKAKKDAAVIYVVDCNGICWAANRGYVNRGMAIIKTGYGDLWFKKPSAVFVLDKDASKKRISKILQMNSRYCIRIDK